MTEPEALERFLAEIRQAYPHANHYTFAYRINASHQRASDDGEPQGTAGLPMLNILSREGWEETLIIVVRYFGGTKLGRGGLVHAYQHVAQLALQSTAPGQRALVRHVLLHVDYAAYERVHHPLKTHVFSQEATFAAEVTLRLILAEAQWPAVQALLDQETGRRWVHVESSLQSTVVLISAPSSE